MYIDILGNQVPTEVLMGYLSLFTICIMSLALPLNANSYKLTTRLIILPAIIYNTYHIYVSCYTKVKTPGNRYGLPSNALGICLRSIDLFLFSGDHYKTLFRLKKPITNNTFIDRLKYSLEFWFTFRGIGWNWGSRKTPKVHKSNMPKLEFTMRHLVDFGYRYVIMDIIDNYLRYYGFFSSTPRMMNDLPLFHPFRLVVGFLHGCFLWQIIEMAYSSLVIPCVLLNLSSTDECPPQFGKLSEATSLKSYWSTFWHSNWKKPFVGISLGITRFLRLPNIVGVAGTFAISGLFHSLLAYSAHKAKAGTGIDTMISFLIQPLGIVLEQIFISRILPLIPNKIKYNKSFQPLCYLWVSIWLSLTASPAFDEINASHLFAIPILPFSPIKYLCNNIIT